MNMAPREAAWPIHAFIACGLLFAAGSAAAQITRPIGPPPDSLVQQPQLGATPRPVQPSPSLPPATLPPASTPIGSPIVRPQIVVPVYQPSTPAEQPLRVPRQGGLPTPERDPMHVDPATDPILSLAHSSTSPQAFRQAIGAAVTRNPALGEAVAQADEAEGARNEARARQYPTLDLGVTSYKVISREFSNDPLNLLERQRPRNRTDATARLQQPLLDFGAGDYRIRAGNARLEAAIADIDESSTQIALRAISAWYDVYGYRALVRLGEVFAANQNDMRGMIGERIRRGVSAPGDAAQVESYIASSNTQLADFRRALANAESRYTQLVGTPAPASLARAPDPDPALLRIAGTTDTLPAVRAARALSQAAQQDLRATRADRLPLISLGVDAGRYGVYETARDYDVRGNLTMNLRLGGGAKQRVDQVRARANGADARLRRTEEEATRDARIAASDVVALEQSQQSIEANYIASRQSRDVLAERFRVARGTLFDVMGAESNYFGVAARYIQTLTELDTARYILLARTGKLLTALEIKPAALNSQ
jgi:adhesin transport system outer membrane protein